MFPHETEPGVDSHRTSSRCERNGSIPGLLDHTGKLAHEPQPSRQSQQTFILRLRQVLHPVVPGFRPMLAASLRQWQGHSCPECRIRGTRRTERPGVAKFVSYSRRVRSGDT